MDQAGVERLYQRMGAKALGVAKWRLRDTRVDVEDALQDAVVEILSRYVPTDRDITESRFVRKARDRAIDIARRQRRRWRRHRPIGLFQGREENTPRDDTNAEREAALIPQSERAAWLAASLRSQHVSDESNPSGDEQHEPGIEDIPRIESTLRWAEAQARRDVARLTALGPAPVQWVAQVRPFGSSARKAWLREAREQRERNRRDGTRWRTVGEDTRPATARDTESVALADRLNDLGAWAIPELEIVLARLRDEAAEWKAIRRHQRKSCGLCRQYRHLRKPRKLDGRIGGRAVQQLTALRQRLAELPPRVPRELYSEADPAPLGTFTPKPEHTPGCAPGVPCRRQWPWFGDLDDDVRAALADRAWTAVTFDSRTVVRLPPRGRTVTNA